MDNAKELVLDAPWGKINLVARGDPFSQPVLLVHGRQDTAATFTPLIQLLPKRFYYVAVDLPGNGKSDHFPKGFPPTRYLYIYVIMLIVKKMNWNKFIYVGHSMGCEFALFFNVIWPGHISKMIFLDAGPSFQRLQQSDYERFYQHYYDRYYSQYQRYNSNEPKQYTRHQANQAVMKARGLTEAKAEVALSRSLVPTGDNKYRLSWDPRIKYVIPPNLTNAYYLPIFNKGLPPMLLISMTEGNKGNQRGKDGADQLIDGLLRVGHDRRVILAGNHDHHISNAEEIAPFVTEYLNNYCGIKTKL